MGFSNGFKFKVRYDVQVMFFILCPACGNLTITDIYGVSGTSNINQYYECCRLHHVIMYISEST
jgi:hypothetical protein